MSSKVAGKRKAADAAGAADKRSAAKTGASGRKKQSKPDSKEIDKDSFLANAQPLTITISGASGASEAVTLTAEPKTFSTGNVGWTASGVGNLPANSKHFKARITINIVAMQSQASSGDEEDMDAE